MIDRDDNMTEVYEAVEVWDDGGDEQSSTAAVEE